MIRPLSYSILVVSVIVVLFVLMIWSFASGEAWKIALASGSWLISVGAGSFTVFKLFQSWRQEVKRTQRTHRAAHHHRHRERKTVEARPVHQRVH